MIVSYVENPAGRRCYVAGRRLHHGLAGAIVAAAGLLLHRRLPIAAGLLILADDWRDFPFRDCDNRH